MSISDISEDIRHSENCMKSLFKNKLADFCKMSGGVSHGISNNDKNSDFNEP